MGEFRRNRYLYLSSCGLRLKDTAEVQAGNAADGVKKRPARWRQEGTETVFCLAETGKRRQRDDKRGGRGQETAGAMATGRRANGKTTHRTDMRGGRQDIGVDREKRRRRRKCRAKKGGGRKSAAARDTAHPVYWAMQMLTRFCSTPGKGWTVSPLPSAEMRSAAMPACSNAAATPAARCRESFRLRACEPVAASA